MTLYLSSEELRNRVSETSAILEALQSFSLTFSYSFRNRLLFLVVVARIELASDAYKAPALTIVLYHDIIKTLKARQFNRLML